ncbi:hypothetical protein K7X08_001172 [Anisodus acutangulus]|uniref:Uncharacterized protein n=1 Tax=Anisodus acutangulus TaxID=402998 RepID=A0A9Q1RN52_9SOLA|nr:hypothetical protein K7X08_001172 [Anisodus acutangulus]
MKKSLMALVVYVESEQLRMSEKAKNKQEALKDKVSEAPVQKIGIIKTSTPVAEVVVSRPTAQVEKATDILMSTDEIEAKHIPAKVDENVVPIGEAEKAKDEPAKVVENAIESSQADVEFDSKKNCDGRCCPD